MKTYNLIPEIENSMRKIIRQIYMYQLRTHLIASNKETDAGENPYLMIHFAA